MDQSVDHLRCVAGVECFSFRLFLIFLIWFMGVSLPKQTYGQLLYLTWSRLDVLIDRATGLFADCWVSLVGCHVVDKHKIQQSAMLDQVSEKFDVGRQKRDVAAATKQSDINSLNIESRSVVGCFDYCNTTRCSHGDSTKTYTFVQVAMEERNKHKMQQSATNRLSLLVNCWFSVVYCCDKSNNRRVLCKFNS